MSPINSIFLKKFKKSTRGPHFYRSRGVEITDQGSPLHVKARSEELLGQQSFAIKNQLGSLEHNVPMDNFLPFAGDLWHTGAYNTTIPCIKSTYPYVIKEPVVGSLRF